MGVNQRTYLDTLQDPQIGRRECIFEVHRASKAHLAGVLVPLGDRHSPVGQILATVDQFEDGQVRGTRHHNGEGEADRIREVHRRRERG